MKKQKFNGFFAILLVALTIVSSCSKMNDLGDRFLDKGSIIYAPKVDSVTLRPGDGKIGIECHIKTARVAHVEIWWDAEHFETLEVGNKTGTFTKVLTLDESSYIFNIISVDQWGNKSLPVEATGEVYGAKFRKALGKRLVSGIKYNARLGFIVEMGSVPKYCYYSLLTYTNISDEQVTVEVPTDSTSVMLANWKSGLAYSTVFRPSDAAIDTFMTKVETFSMPSPLPFDKSTWSIVDKDSEVNGIANNYAPNAINGRYNDRWHTASNAWPHWMIVDLGGPVPIKRFGLMPSSFDTGGAADVRFPKIVRWEVSNDGTTWTSLGDFPTVAPAPGVEQYFDVTPTTARYFRFTGVIGTYDGDPNNNYMVISELDVEL